MLTTILRGMSSTVPETIRLSTDPSIKPVLKIFLGTLVLLFLAGFSPANPATCHFLLGPESPPAALYHLTAHQDICLVSGPTFHNPNNTSL